MKNLITKEKVKELWEINGKKPCDTTIWKRTRKGEIPTPIRVGTTNLYNRDEVIRLRDKALGI